MHLIGPLQVPKCDSDLIQLMQVSICRNLQVYTETCLTRAGYARQIYTMDVAIGPVTGPLSL